MADDCSSGLKMQVCPKYGVKCARVDSCDELVEGLFDFLENELIEFEKVFGRLACSRCEHFQYCSRCGRFECFVGGQLSEVPCSKFVAVDGEATSTSARSQNK